MKSKVQVPGVFLLIILYSCSDLMKSSAEKLFDIKDAFYQSWVAGENDKGTNIFIQVNNVKEGVVFDSVVFRGLVMPVFVENKEGIFHLKGMINLDISKLQVEKKVSDKPDQLIYRYHGTRHSCILKNIRRENMKYY